MQNYIPSLSMTWKNSQALFISGFAVVVSIVAVCLSTCTRTIKIDETQYQEMKQHCLIDSIAKKDTLF